MFKHVSQIFIKGILTVLPVVITAALLVWLFNLVEFFFGGLLHLILPRNWYYAGMGLALGIVVIFVIGVMVQVWLGKKIVSIFESIILRIPVIKTIYQPIKSVQNMLTQSDESKPGKPVIVKIREGVEMVGLVMNDHPGKQLNRKDNKIAVLLPWSYQMGGFTILVDSEKVEPLDIPVDQLLKFAITAGISVNKD